MILGVDLGGTKIQAVAVDGDRIVADAKLPTPETGGEAIAAAVADAVRAMGVEGIERVGIGAPGVIDRDRGTVVRAPNLAISSTVPLAGLVAGALGLDPAHVALDNDVNVATIAEHRRGAAVGARDALCVFVGTGVGGGLVVDGGLRRGPNGLTGEIGHMIVREGGRPCGCGGLGHLEAYAGRRSLEAEARRIHESGRETALVQLARDGRMKSSVFEKALAAGDEVARELVDGAADALGAALASAIALVDLELIVLGGGLGSRLGEPFVDRVRAAVDARLFVPSMPLRISLAALGDLGGALGAALLWE